MSEKTTAQKLRAMMKARGVSQHELARRSGSNQANISKYCNGRGEPKDETLERIAKALNCKPEAIRGAKSHSYMRISVPEAISRLLEEPEVEVIMNNGRYSLMFNVTASSNLYEFVKNAARAKRFLDTEAMDAEMYKDLIEGLTARYEMAMKKGEK